MKIIHLFTFDNNEKFIFKFKEFVNSNFNHENHFFYSIKKTRSLKEIIKLSDLIKEADKIIIHGLTSGYLELLLFCHKSALAKTYWGMWGGDLYYHEIAKKSISYFIREMIRKSIVPKFGGLVTQIRGDYELARKWYGAQNSYYYCFMYPSNMYKEYAFSSKAKDKLYIQIGNSGSLTNKHIEVFEKLSKYKDKSIEIICPLSYSGKEEYIKQVIEAGYEIFGKEKFTPITDFMPFDQYLELLAKVDIAIFNHKRQRGLGNITTLLGLGKKVYIREEITTWQFCTDHDLKVYSANGNYDDLFEEMDEGIRQKNIENVKSKFSEEKLVEDLKQIFDEEIN